ncbi:MAG: type III-A CRISPR-associated RAMP protein Csm5 [Eubacteriaceae bacterium]|nr:type III-A CRISPR-associated RAMP protein Csm5 [Eubacteriaceae bacterium]
MVSKIIELETLTSLFIKGKEEKYGEGFIRIGNTVFLIDNDNLCKYIDESNKTTEYAQYFSHRESDVKSFLAYNCIDLSENDISEYERNEKKFKRFLNNRNQHLQRFEDYQAYKDLSISYFLKKEGVFPSQSKVEKDLATGVTKLHSGNRFTQNGNDRYYIPGSSLKGAFRNAVLWKILTEPSKQSWFQSLLRYHLPIADVVIHENNFKAVNQIINQHAVLQSLNLIRSGQVNRRKIKDLKKKYSEHLSEIPDANSNTVESKSFAENTPHIPVSDSFEKDYKEYIEKYNDRWRASNDTLRDFFRLVKITDANFSENVLLRAKTAKAICKDNVGQTYKKDHTTTLECAPKAVKALFKISIDTELAKVFFPQGIPGYLQSVEDLLKVVNEFFRAVSDFENKDFYSGKKSIPNSINGNTPVDTTQVEQLYKSTFGLNSDEILFRTGWGGGFMSKTQFLHLTMLDRVRVRDMIRYNGSPIAPKSRCLIVEDQNATEPLGWCKLTILGDAKDIPLPSIDEAKIETGFLTEQPRQSGQQYPENKERPASEKEIKQSKIEASAIVKKAEKQQSLMSKKIYIKGEQVEGIVKSSVFCQSLTVRIGNQELTIKTNVMKQKEDTVKVQIKKIENGIIMEAILLK